MDTICRYGRLEAIVTSIAKGLALGILAEIQGFRLGGVKFNRQKLGRLMGAIAEWLICAFSAGAPVIRLTFLYIYSKG